MSTRRVYVVAPALSDPLWREKREIVSQACATRGLEAHYPHFTPGAGFDLQAETAKIAASAFALVDLSKERPSCYFELGIVEALDVDFALIAEAGTPLHQTSQPHAVRFYAGLEAFAALVMDILADR
ncbi:MAG: hypothetical protein ABUS48_05625 [Pseudomonadota bacterium]